MIGLYRRRDGVVWNPPVALALAALTFFAFVGTVRNDFIMLDDQEYLADNPIVRQGLSLPGVLWAFTTTHQANWHPTTWLSHMLDVQLFGMNPGAHHLVSLAIHIACVLLLLMSLRHLTGALWPSTLVAALFAVHPLHVESVAWAAERKDVLSTLLALTALLVYIRAARRSAVSRSAALPLLFALALMAKPMPVSFPFLLLLLDWWPLGRWTPDARLFPPGRLWLEKFPLFLLAGVSAIVTVFAQTQGGAVVSEAILPLPARMANAPLAYSGYLVKAFWPVNLSISYPHPVQMPPWHLLAGSLALLTALTFAAVRGSRRWPWFAVGWFWYLGALVPVIGLIQVGSQGMADRYTYLSLTGIFIAVAWSLARSAGRRPSLRGPLAAAAVAAVLVLAAITARQTALWRNSRTVFEHALSLSAENSLAHTGLGVYLSSEGRFEEALDHYREAVRLTPGNAELIFNRGTALQALGHLQAAEDAYRRALEIDPSHARAWNNLGLVYSKLGRNAASSAAYLRALGSDHRLPQAHFNLGVILASEGQTEAAMARYRAALDFDPGSFQAHTNLGVILAEQGRFREAIVHLRAAAEREPENAAARRNLDNALLALSNRENPAAAPP